MLSHIRQTSPLTKAKRAIMKLGLEVWRQVRWHVSTTRRIYRSTSPRRVDHHSSCATNNSALNYRLRMKSSQRSAHSKGSHWSLWIRRISRRLRISSITCRKLRGWQLRSMSFKHRRASISLMVLRKLRRNWLLQINLSLSKVPFSNKRAKIILLWI